MAKFSGKIGYVVQTESRRGVWEDISIDKQRCGDFVKNAKKITSSDNLNDELTVANVISIIADRFATDNFRFIRYVEYMGAKWKVTQAEIQYPRILLTIGGLYNDNKTTTPTTFS